MYKVGDIVSAGEIGKKGNYKCILIACPLCGEERWVYITNLKRSSFKGLCPKCYNISKCGSNSSNWKGGKSRHYEGYIKIYMPEHHRADSSGYVYEHILVWEREHGILIPEGHVIHHLNGLKADNRPDNLVCLPVKQHDTFSVRHEMEVKIRFLEAENRQLHELLASLRKTYNYGGA
jgi:hypothetical protein